MSRSRSLTGSRAQAPEGKVMVQHERCLSSKQEAFEKGQ